MIEINLNLLTKSEKRIWVKPTSSRKGHYRKIKGAKEEVKEKKVEGIQFPIPKTEDEYLINVVKEVNEYRDIEFQIKTLDGYKELFKEKDPNSERVKVFSDLIEYGNKQIKVGQQKEVKLEDKKSSKDKEPAEFKKVKKIGDIKSLDALLSSDLKHFTGIVDTSNIDGDVANAVKGLTDWTSDKYSLFGINPLYTKADSLFVVDGKVVGMFAMGRHDIDPDTVTLHHIEVSVESRGKGYGVNMMKHIVGKILKTEGKEYFTLDSAGENSDKFYRKIGMEEFRDPDDVRWTVFGGDRDWMKAFVKAR